LTLLVMVVNENFVLIDHEFGFPDLLFWRFVGIKLKFLGHFLDEVILTILLIGDDKLG
jgi:hypothetical protein